MEAGTADLGTGEWAGEDLEGSGPPSPDGWVPPARAHVTVSDTGVAAQCHMEEPQAAKLELRAPPAPGLLPPPLPGAFPPCPSPEGCLRSSEFVSAGAGRGR